MTYLRMTLSLGAIVGSTACLDAIDALDPMVGVQLAPRCSNEDSDPDNDVSFARDVLPIFFGEAGPVGCTCHLATDEMPIGLDQSGLDLSSYTTLREGGQNSLTTIVIAGAPCDSVLWRKISPGPDFGSRMPFDGPPFLEERTIQLISDWIAEGARDN